MSFVFGGNRNSVEIDRSTQNGSKILHKIANQNPQMSSCSLIFNCFPLFGKLISLDLK